MQHTQYSGNISSTQIPPCCFSFSPVIKNLTKLKQLNVLQIPSGEKRPNHSNTKNHNLKIKKYILIFWWRYYFTFTPYTCPFKYKWQMTGNITFHLYFVITQCFPLLSVRQLLQMDERLNREDFSCSLQLNEYLMHDIRIAHSFQMSYRVSFSLNLGWFIFRKHFIVWKANDK